MIIVNSINSYRITNDGIAMVENALENPNLVQVSVVNGCTIMLYPKAFGIDYLPNGESPSWEISGLNTRLNRNGAHFIYARLNREGRDALIVFSVNDYAFDGSHSGGSASEDYYYVKIGSITATDEQASLDREITLDFGYYRTDKDQNEGTGDSDWKKLFEVTADDLIRPLKRFTSYIVQGTLNIIGKIVLNDKQVSDVARQGDEGEFKEDDETIPTTSLLLGKYLDKLRGFFLNKDREDATDYVQTFKKGIKIGKYTSGLLGTGGAVLIDDDGNSHAEFDYLNIRKKALFTEITVQELKHIGGALIISPAAMVISEVEETSEGYKCYFNRTDSDGKTIYNEFEPGDQGRCQTFNLEKQENGQVGNRYWWRLVVSVGDDFVVFSKTDADTGSDIPQTGDEVAQLGNRSDKTRQNAQIYSAYGSDSPSRKMYQGIDSYSLIDKVIKDEYFDVTSGRFKEVTYGDAYFGDRNRENYFEFDTGKGVNVKGRVDMEKGSTGAANLEDLPDEIGKAVKIGGENLLLNTGFTGGYESLKLTPSTVLESSTDLYSPLLEHWNGDGIVQEDKEATSGFSCKVGNIYQNVSLIEGETYVASLKAKGVNVRMKCGDELMEQQLTSAYARCVFKFVSTGGDVPFSVSGNATVCEIKLERGTIATDWCPSVLDAPSVTDKFKHLWYLQDAMKGSTDVLGGLILSTLIQLGKYTDGVMEKVDAGMSGIYNDDTDVAFWAGGTFEQAIITVQKLIAGEVPSDEEWSSMAKFVATHGGNVFLRGYIYALGGYFRGIIDLGNGTTRFDSNGTGWIGKKDNGEPFIEFDGERVRVNGIIEAEEGSRIGDVTVGESGALVGAGMITLKSYYAYPIFGGMGEDITGKVRTFLKDNIGKGSIYDLSVLQGVSGQTYDVLLPGLDDVLEKIPEMSGTSGFPLTLVVPSTIFGSIANDKRYRLYVTDDTKLYDNNGGEMSELFLEKGDVVELIALKRMKNNMGSPLIENRLEYYVKSMSR